MRFSFFDKDSRNQQLVVYTLAIVLLGVAQPFLWNFVEDRAEVLQQLRARESDTTEVNERNRALEEDLASQKDFLNQLDVVIPPQAQLTQVVERLEQLADRQTLQIDISAIQEITPVKGSGREQTKSVVSGTEIQPIGVAIVVRGTAPQLLTYIDQVEHLQELSVIRTFRLEPDILLAPLEPGAERIYKLTAEVLFFLSTLETDGQ